MSTPSTTDKANQFNYELQDLVRQRKDWYGLLPRLTPKIIINFQSLVLNILKDNPHWPVPHIRTDGYNIHATWSDKEKAELNVRIHFFDDPLNRIHCSVSYQNQKYINETRVQDYQNTDEGYVISVVKDFSASARDPTLSHLTKKFFP